MTVEFLLSIPTISTVFSSIDGRLGICNYLAGVGELHVSEICKNEKEPKPQRAKLLKGNCHMSTVEEIVRKSEVFAGKMIYLLWLLMDAGGQEELFRSIELIR